VLRPASNPKESLHGTGSANEQAAKTPLAWAGVDDDGTPELVYLENNSSPAELKYVDDVGGRTASRCSGTTTETGSGATRSAGLCRRSSTDAHIDLSVPIYSEKISPLRADSGRPCSFGRTDDAGGY